MMRVMGRRSSKGGSVHVALLRAINLGGKRTIAKADLIASFEAAGATDVSTYIASGNVVFRHGLEPGSLSKRLERQLAADAGFEVPVVLRTASELAAAVGALPFVDAPPETLAVSFLATAPPANALAHLDVAIFEPERFALVGRELYLCLPNGMGRSKLAGTLARQRSVAAATTRTWRTVVTLGEMAAVLAAR